MEARMRQPLLQYTRNGGHADYNGFDGAGRTVVREVGVRNLYIRRRLHTLADAFRAEGIRFVALKGCHLVHTMYPFGIRPIEDIDILVGRDDFGKVDRIIRSMGYVDRVEGMDVWTHLMFSNKITYLNRGANPIIPIDVHFSLGPYPYLGRLGPELIGANTETIDTPEGRLDVLAPEVLLLHLCLHLFQHHFDEWEVSCCDIAAVIRDAGHRLDWEKFVSLSEANRLSLPVAYSLRKAAELAATDIPAVGRLEASRTSAFERWVFATSRKQRTNADRYALQYLTTPGAAVKLRGAVKIVAPGSVYLRKHHGGSYLRYVLHTMKTAVKN